MRIPAIGAMLLAASTMAGTAAAGTMTESAAVRADAVLPAVVSITAPAALGPEFPDEDNPTADLFRELFGEMLTQERRQTVGTGVILDPDGLVVTSAHVLSRLGDLEAVTADGGRHPVTLAGIDRKSDLAILRLGGKAPYPRAALGDSDGVRVGDWVLAIGSPYGLGPTVTGGIISATARPHPRATVDDLFQTDAATFPESAGGPLVNARGEVIGILTVLSSQEFGISFAMPINAARNIVAQLAKHGTVSRGSLGAAFQAVTPGLARALKLSDAGGLLITDVLPRGAAAAAGLRRGDVVTKLLGRNLEAPYDAERALLDSVPGQTAELTYRRQGETRTSRVTLGREVKEAPGRPLSSRPAAMLRFDVRALTPELGVVVTDVRPDRSGAEPGVRPGDIVREINYQPVRTLEDFQRLVDSVKAGDWLALLVQRGRAALYVAVEARRADVSAMSGDP
jgi:serine protease Do